MSGIRTEISRIRTVFSPIRTAFPRLMPVRASNKREKLPVGLLPYFFTSKIMFMPCRKKDTRIGAVAALTGPGGVRARRSSILKVYILWPL